jgi:hypothetical protein
VPEQTSGPGAAPALVVPARFNGPSGGGNGGYVAGLLAARLTSDPTAPGSLEGVPVVTVTLRRQPPLDTPMAVETSEGRARLLDGSELVAEAEPGRLQHEAVEPVPYDVAETAMARYGGLAHHPFPECVVCGTDRPAPDGLGLRPGRLGDRPDTVATAWLPTDPSSGEEGVPVELVWAALDCPGAWAAGLEELAGRALVLGRVTAEVAAVPEPAEPCVVLGRQLATEGRKRFTATAVYDRDGRVLARAESIWFEVDPAAFGNPA